MQKNWKKKKKMRGKKLNKSSQKELDANNRGEKTNKSIQWMTTEMEQKQQKMEAGRSQWFLLDDCGKGHDF